VLRRDTVATDLLLIRHGRSADVVPGSPESLDPPLHVEGRRQAAALAQRLEPKRIDAIYASHLTRAVQTAQPLAEQRGLDIESFEDLEEVRLGDWSAGEFRRRAAVADPEWIAWNRTRRWDGIPGAEGDTVFRTRVSAAIEAIVGRHHGETVAIVVHGGVIQAYIAEALGIHLTLWLVVENTSISVVRVDEDGHHVVVANDCNHLYDPVLQG
jgi:2,3-bisphosphoglycerate-dependent phosphoglycerate mutase